jgi:hypothetical protein
MWLLALGCGLLLTASGCCGYSHGCGCGSDMCGACGNDCGPIYRQRPLVQRGCGDDCDSCAPCRGGCNSSCGGCDSCCDDGCQRNFCFHPFRWVGNLFCADSWCGPRCGGETCGGCDGSGAELGGQYGYTAPRRGCSNCNHGGAAYDGGDMSAAPDGEVMQGEASPEPTPAPASSKTSRRPSRQTPEYN